MANEFFRALPTQGIRPDAGQTDQRLAGTSLSASPNVPGSPSFPASYSAAIPGTEMRQPQFGVPAPSVPSLPSMDKIPSEADIARLPHRAPRSARRAGRRRAVPRPPASSINVARDDYDDDAVLAMFEEIPHELRHPGRRRASADSSLGDRAGRARDDRSAGRGVRQRLLPTDSKLLRQLIKSLRARKWPE